jgi:hypothetical protein
MTGKYPSQWMEPLMFDIDSLWPESDPGNRALPEPTVDFRAAEATEEFTEEQVKGILTNPVYAGIGPYPPMVDDAQWVRACKKLIDEEGAEQFLVNLLYVLRQSFQVESDESE